MTIALAPTDLLTTGVAPPHGVVAAVARPRGTPRLVVLVLALAGLALTCWLSVSVLSDPDFVVGSTTPVVDGLTIFAVFFVAALMIERLLEPFTSWLVPADDAKAAAASDRDAATTALVSGGSSATVNTAVEKAAQSAANLAEKKWQRSVTMWAIASAVGMWVASSMHLYFLSTVGIASAARWQEVLATGLIIGAGTKPLHDLTELIAAKKDAAA
ncbi:hypothetical protein GXP71_01235 [Cellulomonas sp. H30R-01]|uniref:hypothetical protein n=1 Tax=Cellulomonas sp. H30R-01 TaxID=2704467 RepID=UPI00138D5D66|nr:hypothetical protein [Cellulomonas sp. H30R-01]QHT54855.1 hypothetical protein GXP71_01235 [Cellulomonas sp. H30R-01]